MGGFPQTTTGDSQRCLAYLPAGPSGTRRDLTTVVSQNLTTSVKLYQRQTPGRLTHPDTDQPPNMRYLNQPSSDNENTLRARIQPSPPGRGFSVQRILDLGSTGCMPFAVQRRGCAWNAVCVAERCFWRAWRERVKAAATIYRASSAFSLDRCQRPKVSEALVSRSTIQKDNGSRNFSVLFTFGTMRAPRDTDAGYAVGEVRTQVSGETVRIPWDPSAIQRPLFAEGTVPSRSSPLRPLKAGD